MYKTEPSLSSLEKIIKKWYQDNGYDASWLKDWFKIEIDARFKAKGIMVIDLTSNHDKQMGIIYKCLCEDYDTLFEKAIRFFSKEEYNIGNGVDHKERECI